MPHSNIEQAAPPPIPSMLQQKLDQKMATQTQQQYMSQQQQQQHQQEQSSSMTTTIQSSSSSTSNTSSMMKTTGYTWSIAEISSQIVHVKTFWRNLPFASFSNYANTENCTRKLWQCKIPSYVHTLPLIIFKYCQQIYHT